MTYKPNTTKQTCRRTTCRKFTMSMVTSTTAEFSWVDFWPQALGGSLLLVEIYSSKEVLSRYHHSPRLKFLPLMRGSVIKWCDIWLPATLLCRLCQVTFCLALQRLQLSRVILILCSFRQFVSNFPVHKIACKALFGSQFLGGNHLRLVHVIEKRDFLFFFM